MNKELRSFHNSEIQEPQNECEEGKRERARDWVGEKKLNTHQIGDQQKYKYNHKLADYNILYI